MTDLPRAEQVARAGTWSGAADRVVLDYEGRFLRRRRLVAEGGLTFLADLPETMSLEEGDAFALADGRFVAVAAAAEPLYRITGDVARLAWHIGNRHTPCEIERGRLTIRRDPVLRRMIEGLGAEVTDDEGPFRPEGGAYGMGRVMGHDHGPHGPHVSHAGFRHHLSDEEPEEEGDQDPPGPAR